MPPVTRMVTKHRKKQQKIIDLVKCVIREQPDQKERALNCDGHGVYRKEFYKGKIPDEWMCEMDSLVSTHEGIFDHQYNTFTADGIGSLCFHHWVSRQIRAVDSSFEFDQKIGRGFQAQAIYSAVRDWANARDERE